MLKARLPALASIALAALIAPAHLLAGEAPEQDASEAGSPGLTSPAPASEASVPGTPETEGAAEAAPVTQASPGSGAAASASRTTAIAAAKELVSVGDNFYSPKTVTITAGDTVQWNNDGQVAHTVTFDDGSFDTGAFDAGQSRSRKFTAPGTFTYYCTIHGRVQSGTVKVASASSGGSNKKSGGSEGGASGQAAPSEAAAGRSADAAGTEEVLAATGSETPALAAAGLLMVAAGLLLGSLRGGPPPLAQRKAVR